MAYDLPEPSELQERYPAFAAVPTLTVQSWIEDATRTVDQSWREADYSVAIMALAAHNMERLDIAAGAAQIPAGVTDFKSASFSAEVVAAKAKGGYASTPYGQEFAELLRANRGGARVASGGAAPCPGSLVYNAPWGV